MENRHIRSKSVALKEMLRHRRCFEQRDTTEP